MKITINPLWVMQRLMTISCLKSILPYSLQLNSRAFYPYWTSSKWISQHSMNRNSIESALKPWNHKVGFPEQTTWGNSEKIFIMAVKAHVNEFIHQVNLLGASKILSPWSSDPASTAHHCKSMNTCICICTCICVCIRIRIASAFPPASVPAFASVPCADSYHGIIILFCGQTNAYECTQ